MKVGEEGVYRYTATETTIRRIRVFYAQSTVTVILGSSVALTHTESM